MMIVYWDDISLYKNYRLELGKICLSPKNKKKVIKLRKK